MEDHMTDREMKVEAALVALVEAIDAKWKGDPGRRRDNALGPQIEAALSDARKLVGGKVRKTRGEELTEERDRLLAELAARGIEED